MPVRDFHRERQAVLLDLDRVSRFRHAADAVVDKTPNRVVFLGVLEIAQLNIEQFRHVIDRRPPVDANLIVGQTDRQRLFRVVLVLDVADYLLEQILDRDHPGGAAVLVEHDGQVDSAALQHVEKVVDRHRLGRKKGRPEEFAEVRLWPCEMKVSMTSSMVAVTGRAVMSVRGTMTSWMRRPPSSMTALIICSSSASRMPVSPPRSTMSLSSSVLI